ncbi:MAG: MBL fold metallo-hydrolase [Butyrivibrio sp.]
MKLVKVTDRIYYLQGNEETDRPFLYYIKGIDYSVAIDAGQSKQHVEQFYQAIAEEGFPYPRYTVITHWHWDHTFGIAYIKGETIANELTKQKLMKVSEWEWTQTAMEQREKDGEDIAFCNDCIKKEYPNLSDITVKSVDIGISQMQELDLGDIHVQLYPIDSIHSRDALLIYVPEEKALFVGDADCADCYENGKVDMDKLESYIQFVGGFEFDYYLMGHDYPDNKDGVMKYLKELENEARKIYRSKEK